MGRVQAAHLQARDLRRTQAAVAYEAAQRCARSVGAVAPTEFVVLPRTGLLARSAAPAGGRAPPFHAPATLLSDQPRGEDRGRQLRPMYGLASAEPTTQGPRRLPGTVPGCPSLPAADSCTPVARCVRRVYSFPASLREEVCVKVTAARAGAARDGRSRCARGRAGEGVRGAQELGKERRQRGEGWQRGRHRGGGGRHESARTLSARKHACIYAYRPRRRVSSTPARPP